LGEQVAKLIERLHPDTPVAQLERDAGLRPGQIARFKKKSEKIQRVPPAHTLLMLARACSCLPQDFLRAFCVDVGIPLDDPPLSEAAEEMVILIQRLPEREQQMILTMTRTLVAACASAPGANSPSVEVAPRQPEQDLAN